MIKDDVIIFNEERFNEFAKEAYCDMWECGMIEEEKDLGFISCPCCFNISDEACPYHEVYEDALRIVSKANAEVLELL